MRSGWRWPLRDWARNGGGDHAVQLLRVGERHSARRGDVVLADIEPATFNLDPAQ